MEYSQTNIIELNETQSHLYDPNNITSTAGDYDITLDKPLFLENNDVVSIKATFIDTVETGSDKIRVTKEEANSMSVSFCMYVQNHTADGKLYDGWTQYQTGSTDYQDNAPYFLMDTTLNVDFDTVDSIVFHQNTNPRKGKDHHKWGWNSDGNPADINLSFKITKPSGELVTYTINMPYAPITNSILTYTYDNTVTGSPFPIKIKQNTTVQLIPLTSRDATTWDRDHVTGNPPATYTRTNTAHPVSCELKRFTHNFQIPEGNYDKEALAKQITDTLINATSSLEVPFLVERARKTPFMITTLLLRTLPEYGMNTQPNIIWGKADSTRFLEFRGQATEKEPPATGDTYTILNGEKSFVLGTDQIALVYDPDIQSYNFTQLHQDILDPLTGQPAVEFRTTGAYGQGVVDINRFYAGRHGGICFTDVQPRSLWQDKMGFDMSKLLIKEQSQDLKNINSLWASISLPKILIVDGENATNSIIGIDATINAGSNQVSGADYQVTPVLDDTIRYIDNTLLKKIYASNVLGNSLEGKGYFLVSVSGLPQTLVSADGLDNSVQSIVSRFYQNNNYTTDQGSGSIQYVHRGEPKLISKFHVRILDPNKEISTDINNSSVVFLQLNKATQ